MALCGTINADGTVRVRLSWRNGAGDIAYLEAHVGVYGGDYRVINIPGPIAPGTTQSLDIPDLVAGQTYAFTLRTYYAAGSAYLDSAQMQFETPAGRIPATNLACTSP